MEIKLTGAEAVPIFNAWHAEMVARGGLRRVEGGAVLLDTVPSAPGAVHQMDGSLVYVYYRAANPSTDRQIREASVAVQMMNIPRQLYTGKLVDIKKGRDGTVYFMVRAIERRDEDNNGAPAFRCFNPSKGQIIEMTINPSAAAIAAQQQAPVIQSVSPAPAAAPAPEPVQPLEAGMVVRRRSNP